MSSWKVENVPAMPDFTTETSSCRAAHLSDLLDLRPAFTDEGTALARWDDQP